MGLQLPEEVQLKLDELGGGAGIRLRLVVDAGPWWAAGWYQRIPPEVKEQAARMLAKGELDIAGCMACIDVLRWDFKEAFPIMGRMPHLGDVEELRKRDYLWKYERRQQEEEIAKLVKAQTTDPTVKDGAVERWARDYLTSDKTVWKYARLGRRGVLFEENPLARS